MARAALSAVALAAAALGCGGAPGAKAGADAAADRAAEVGAPDTSPDACGLGAPIAQLAYSTDGRWLAIARADGRVEVHELGGTVVRRLRVDGGAPLRVALTEDGALLVAASNGTVKVWAVADGRLVRQLAADAGTIVSLKLSDDPAPMLLAAFDPRPTPADNVRIWRVSDGILVGLLTGSPLATFTHADAAVLLLDEAQARYEVRSFGGRLIRGASFPQPLARTAFAADGAYLGGVTRAGTDDERIAIMSVSDERFVWQSSEATRATRALVFLENPSRVVQLGPRALVYDHADGKVLTSLPSLADAATAAASPDGTVVAAATAGGEIVLVSSSDGARRPATAPGPCP